MATTVIEQGESSSPTHFLKQRIEADLASGQTQQLTTRFPPEPNGYLHIGHAKAIWINFGLAQEFDGHCHLRMDDTNPEKEDDEFVQSIQADIRWLGYEWHGPVRFASDYFLQLFECARKLIEQDRAYVCSLSAEQTREYRGTLTTPGRNSPDRDRAVAESLRLFEEMRAGQHEAGSLVLRAKIDMSSPNMNMRDPTIYRIRYVHHHRTGDQWCIYPLYDYAHCVSDAIEGITHSMCSLEFEDHRPLYNWILEQLEFEPRPSQVEFARLNTNYLVTSKRKLKQLIDAGEVSSWDDPRLPTISGLRRRGYTPKALRQFCVATGVTKANAVVDIGMLEWAIRDDLDSSAPRAMCVIRPLKVTLTNYPADKQEQLTLPCHPKDESMGERQVVLSKTLWIDQADFMEDAPKKFFRLTVGKEVRLRGAYIVRCDEAIKDESGEVVELRCSYDPDTLGKMPTDRKVKGVIHWVSADKNQPVEVRLYDRLFTRPDPEGVDEAGEPIAFLDVLNPDSLQVQHGFGEQSLSQAIVGSRFQFEREGYFCIDTDSSPTKLVVNQTVSLKDSWAKQDKKSS